MVWQSYLAIILVAAVITDLSVRLGRKWQLQYLSESKQQRLQQLMKLNRSDLDANQQKELRALQKKQAYSNLIVSGPSLGIFIALRKYIRQHFVIKSWLFILSYSLIRVLITRLNDYLIKFLASYLDLFSSGG